MKIDTLRRLYLLSYTAIYQLGVENAVTVN